MGDDETFAHEPEPAGRQEPLGAEDTQDDATSVGDLLRGDGIRRFARTGRGDPDTARQLLGLQRAAGNAAVARLLRQLAPPAEAPERGPAGGRLLADSAPTAGGQMTKDEFLDRVRAGVLETARAALEGTLFTAAGCPWVEHWIGYYRGRSAAEVEDALGRYAPDARAAASPGEAVGAVCARVASGIAEWRATGVLPVEGPVAARTPEPARPVLARAADPRATIAELGAGRPLRAAERRVAAAFAPGLDDVRVHDDAAGARLARRLEAGAVAVGRHVAFAPNTYEPGTPLGDALLAHELAHVGQQGAAAPPGQTGELERDADLTAASALARLIAGPDVAAAQPRRSSRLALQRCGSDELVTLARTSRPYQDVVADLLAVEDHKAAVLAGEEAEDPELLASETDLIAELQAMGIRLEAIEIVSRLLADRTVDLRRVAGRVLRLPDGEVRWGQRLTFQTQLDYVPPGRVVEYEWRWRAGPGEREYHFVDAPGRSRRDHVEHGEGFWMAQRDGDVGRTRKIEVLVRVYLGSEKTAQAMLSTGPIDIGDERVPNPLTLEADPPAPVVGGNVRFRVADWAPQWTHHELIWSVDGREEGTDTVGFRRSFATPGTHVVALHVNQVRRSLGVRERTPLSDGRLELQVLDVSQASNRMLDQMRPGSAMLPATRDLEKSLVSSIAEIERHVAEGGEQREYWRDRLEVQRHRLEQLRANAFDLEHVEALPVDPADLDAAHAYNGPIPAVLSMPSGAGVQPLTIHVSAHREGDQWVSRLIDMTSKDVFERTGRGGSALEAHRAAFRAWMADHPYPRGGTVTYRFPAAGWDVDTSFRTKDTAWDTAVAWLDGIVTVGGFIAAGLLLAAPEATVTKWLGYTILVMSVARSGIAIYENVNSGIPLTDTRNVLEGVSILTSFLGVGGSALRTAGIRTINPAMYRAGNWVLMTGLAADAGTLVAVTADGLGQLQAIQGDPTLDEGQRSAAIVRLISGLALRQALFFISNQGLLRQGLRPSDFVHTDPRASARVGPSGAIELSTGSRLDLALEFKRAGDMHVAPLAAGGKMPAAEILDRHAMLPWLKKLPAAQIPDVSRRLTTAAMAKLQGITAAEARTALDHIGDDVLFNRMAVAYGGPRVQALAAGIHTIKTTLAGDAQRIALLGQVADLELGGKVAGFEKWVAQTAAQVTPGATGAQAVEQHANVERMTGELSAMKAFAAEQATQPGATVLFTPAPPTVPGTPTPRSFDIAITQRPVGEGPPTIERLIEVETVMTPVRSSVDLQGGIAHAASKLPLTRPKPGSPGPATQIPGEALPTASKEAGVVVAQWPPPATTSTKSGNTTTFHGDGSYTQSFPSGGSRSGHLAEDLLNDLNGRLRRDGTRGVSPLDDVGAQFLDRVNVIDGRTGRVAFSLVNDPAGGGAAGPRHNWRRE